ncbi:mannose-6-phosphate isomerase-like [Liolophura sinensis]|uniref:mannose-6-phosphate isomerase-like n=1 Tax=Liolophura sinensis TaxID=3198878 RepID=UPI0031587FF5
MGTHPSGPSTAVFSDGKEMLLSDWIRKHPDQLGDKVKAEFDGQLPFLFKVLSVNTSLSIQTHPNKVQAEALHKARPDLYKDANHKPELAIALTPFQGLCGFRPIKQVANFLETIPELRAAVGNEYTLKLIAASRTMDMPFHREAMKECFNSLMNQDQDAVKEELGKLVGKVQQIEEDKGDTSPFVGDILLKLHREFPGDIGCFVAYFLNLMKLQPGQAMFLEANLPHAYLSGNCMECMACSDNVIRAGLTSKYIDKVTLVKMLNYTGQPATRNLFKPRKDKHDPCVELYEPGVKDFCVSKVQLSHSVSNYTLCSLDSASICIVTQGEGEAKNDSLPKPISLQRGVVFFVSAEEKVIIVNKGDMIIFRAYCNLATRYLVC